MEIETTIESTPKLVDVLPGHHQGEGYGNGKTKQARKSLEWYNNFDNTYTMKKVIWIKTTEVNEEHIEQHRTVIKNIDEKEYFKRKLAGTLFNV